MLRWILLSALVVSAVATESHAHAQIIRAEDNLVVSAAVVLDELAKIPLQGIPSSLLAQAQGVVICPNVVKAGFVLGGRTGRGVLVTRDPNGGWSAPVFMRLNGGSIGFQAGVESTDVVLVLRTQQSVQGLLTGRRFTLGGDASISAGPVGREVSAATDVRLQSEILSYSRSRGLFAGASFSGTALKIDDLANAVYYGRNDVTAAQIVAGQNIAVPASTLELQKTLSRDSIQTLPAAVPMPTAAKAGIPAQTKAPTTIIPPSRLQ